MNNSSNSRQLMMVNRDRCGVCGCCVPACPSGALILYDAYLHVDQEACTDCMKCVSVCPTKALYGVSAEAVVSFGGA
jgi:ferredoxin